MVRMKLPNSKQIYLPDIVGGGYGKFWKDKSRYRVLKGGKGSKKSTTTALNYIYRLMKYPGSNLLVVRAVMNTHRDSTFAQLKLAQEMIGVSHLWRNTVSPMEMVYIPTGQKILFRGFDDVLKLASTTVSKGYLCWVWIEEAYEIESETDFEKLDLSVPRSMLPEPLFNQTTLTFNPWSEAHWLKRRFFDEASSLTSTYSTNYLCNEHLSSEYHTAMEELKERNYRRYAVAGLGEWGIAEGLVFENWEKADFEINEKGTPILNGASGTPFSTENQSEEEDISWQYKHFFGLDYGYTNDPTAFIAFVVNPMTKEIFIYDEHYEHKMLNSDIAAMIKRKGFAKERIRADAAEPKSNDDLRRLGISRIMSSVKGKDSVINGIAKLQEYKIYVHPRCNNMITELSSYCWKKDKQTDKPLNEPEDSNNHLCDALRYAFEDVKFFHPENPKFRRRRTAESQYSVTGDDFKEGWD